MPVAPGVAVSIDRPSSTVMSMAPDYPNWASAVEFRGEIVEAVDQVADALDRGMLARVFEPVAELVAHVTEDAAEAVLARHLHRSRLRARVARGLASRRTRSLAGRLGLAQLAFERLHPVGDRVPRRLRRARRRRPVAQLVVGLLDLLEAPRRLRRIAVVIGVVLLDQAPIGVVKIFGGGVRGNAEHPVWIASHALQPSRHHARRS